MLRDYQKNGVDRLRNSYAHGKRAPLYQLPTGGGKTHVFSHIAERMTARNRRAVILVHRQELLMQASRSLRGMDVPHALIAPGFRFKGESIAVASVQTLVRRLKKLSDSERRYYDFDLIIIDEAHHAVAGTWAKIIAEFPRAKLLGVTATPTRSDGKGLGVEAGGCFDDLIVGPSVRELIAGGHLVTPVVFAPQSRLDLSGVHMRGGDYNAKELAEVIDKPKITGDAVAHYARLCPFKPAIVFCVSVAHAEHVAGEFRAAGFRAHSIDGTMADGQRRGLIRGLGSGEVDVLTSCDLISEGTDIPVVEAAILLRPTQSESLYLQQVGRALRPAPGKDRAIILDHVGNCLIHGLPDDDREWSLAGVTKRGRKAPDEKADALKQCESCFVWNAAGNPVCINCGTPLAAGKPREIKQVEGELKQLTGPEIEALRKQRTRERGQSIKTLEDAFAWGMKNNYKNPAFWAKHYMRTSRKQHLEDREVLARWSAFKTSTEVRP